MAAYNIFKTDTQAARFLGQGKPLFPSDTRAARFMGANLGAHPSFVYRDEVKYGRGTVASGHAGFSLMPIGGGGTSGSTYYWS
jgi:hypothetical protein